MDLNSVLRTNEQSNVQYLGSGYTAQNQQQFHIGKSGPKKPYQRPSKSHEQIKSLQKAKQEESITFNIQEYDFKYQFQQENQVKLIKELKIDELTTEQKNQMNNEIKKFSISFVIEKLSDRFKVQTGPKSQYPDLHDINKITWAELFINQPGIQKLSTDYLSEINRVLELETIQNQDQLIKYLKFPRFQSNNFYNKKAKSQTRREIVSCDQREDRRVINKTVKLQTIYEERSEQMNVKTSFLDALRKNPDFKINKEEDEMMNKRKKSKHKSVEGFIESLPETIRKKNNFLFKRIQIHIEQEGEAKTKVLNIINGNRMFGEKLEQMIKFQNEFEEEQRKIKEISDYKSTLDNINSSIRILENDQAELDYNLAQIQPQTHKQSAFLKKPMEKLQVELNKFQEDLLNRYMDDTDLYALKHEYWETAQTFEEVLKQDIKGWELERQGIYNFWTNRERKLKEHYLFKIEAMELGMNEIKLKCVQETERIQMILNDHESQQMNLNVLNKFQTVEHFIHDQQEFIKNLRIDKIKDFESPFAKKDEADRAIEMYKQQQMLEKEKEIQFKLSKRGTKIYRKASKGDNLRRQLDVDTKQLAEQLKKQIEHKRKSYQGTTVIDNSELAVLNSKINHYFQIILRLYTDINNVEQNLNFKDVLMQQVVKEKNELHIKSVKYQDLVHGLFQIATQMLVETNIINSTEQLQITLLSKVEDMKLTLDTTQLEDLVSTLERYEFDGKMAHYKHIKSDIFTKMVQLKNINQEIESSKWMIKKLFGDVEQQFEDEGEDEERDDMTLQRMSTMIQPNKIQKSRTIKINSAVSFQNDQDAVGQSNRTTHRQHKYELDLINLFKLAQNKFDEILRLMNISHRDVVEVKLNIQTNQLKSGKSITVLENYNEKSVLQKKSSLKRQQTTIYKSYNTAEKEQFDKKYLAKKGESTSKSKSLKDKKQASNSADRRVATPKRGKNPGVDSNELIPTINHRMTFFGETSDYYVKPHSKKKIFYMYDQFSNTNIPQKQIEIIQRGLKADAVGHLLLKTKKNQNNVSENNSQGSSYEFSSQTSNDSFDSDTNPEADKLDFESIISTINSELNRHFCIQTIDRYKETTTSKKDQKRLEVYMIKPIDCIKIEPYCAPQLNLIPLKLLMLKKKPQRARDLLIECLHIVSLLMPEVESASSNTTCFRGLVHLDKQTQTIEPYKSDYQRMGSYFEQFLSTHMKQLDNEVLHDKIFIDQHFQQKEVIQMIQKKLVKSDNEYMFLKDLTVDIIQQKNKAVINGQKETAYLYQRQIEELEEMLMEIGDGKNPLKRGTGDNKSGENLTSPLSSAHDKLKSQRLKKLKLAQSGMPKRNLDDVREMKVQEGLQIANILVKEFEKLPMTEEQHKLLNINTPQHQINLPRQDEIIARGMEAITEDILKDMDEKQQKFGKVEIQVDEPEEVKKETKKKLQVIKQKKKTRGQREILRQHDEEIINLSISEATNTEYLSLQDNCATITKTENNEQQQKVLQPVIQVQTLDQEAETDVSMFDLQITLEHKYRSVAKIRQLEEIIEMQKGLINEQKYKLLQENDKNGHSKSGGRKLGSTTCLQGELVFDDPLFIYQKPITQNRNSKSPQPKIQTELQDRLIKIPTQKIIEDEVQSQNMEPNTKTYQSNNIRTPQIELNVNTSNINDNNFNQLTLNNNDQVIFQSIIKDAQEINKNLMTSILTGSKSQGCSLEYNSNIVDFNSLTKHESTIARSKDCLSSGVKMINEIKLFESTNNESTMSYLNNMNAESILNKRNNNKTNQRYVEKARESIIDKHRCSSSIRPKTSSVTGHTGLFGQKRYYEKFNSNNGINLIKYGKSFEKVQSLFNTIKNDQLSTSKRYVKGVASGTVDIDWSMRRRQQSQKSQSAINDTNRCGLSKSFKTLATTIFNNQVKKMTENCSFENISIHNKHDKIRRQTHTAEIKSNKRISVLNKTQIFAKNELKDNKISTQPFNSKIKEFESFKTQMKGRDSHSPQGRYTQQIPMKNFKTNTNQLLRDRFKASKPQGVEVEKKKQSEQKIQNTSFSNVKRSSGNNHDVNLTEVGETLLLSKETNSHQSVPRRSYVNDQLIFIMKADQSRPQTSDNVGQKQRLSVQSIHSKAMGPDVGLRLMTANLNRSKIID